MKWLERYILLERVMKDCDESDDDKIADVLEDAMGIAWEKLNSDDIKYLRGRPKIRGAEALDRIPMPPNMTWIPATSLHYKQPEVLSDWGAGIDWGGAITVTLGSLTRLDNSSGVTVGGLPQQVRGGQLGLHPKKFRFTEDYVH